MPKGTRRMVFKCNTCIIQRAVNICIFLNKILYWILTHNEELLSDLLQLLKNKARKNVFRLSSLKTVQSVFQFNKIFKRLIWTTWPILFISGQILFLFWSDAFGFSSISFSFSKAAAGFCKGRQILPQSQKILPADLTLALGDLYSHLRMQFLKHCWKTSLKQIYET